LLNDKKKVYLKMAGSTITQDQIDQLVDLLRNAGVLQNVFQRKLSGNAITLNDETCPTGTKACEDIDCLEQDVGLDPPVYTVSGAACVPTSYMDMRPKEQSMAIEQLMENLLTQSSSIMSTLRKKVENMSCKEVNDVDDISASQLSKLCGMKNMCVYSSDNKCFDLVKIMMSDIDNNNQQQQLLTDLATKLVEFYEKLASSTNIRNNYTFQYISVMIATYDRNNPREDQYNMLMRFFFSLYTVLKQYEMIKKDDDKQTIVRTIREALPINWNEDAWAALVEAAKR
jgi:hypothetical protein